jgi:thiamine-monophosphate kinase
MTQLEQNFLSIIKKTLSDSSFLGDDCAYLKDFGLCITQDTLTEGIHFSLDTINPRQLGRKALLVNISDILASGACPNYVTVAISGELSSEFIEQFYFGVNEICREYGVTVVGGDLCGGSSISVSVCALGCTKGRNISSRKNAQDGYVVAVCGEFGSSAKGLEDLKIGKSSHHANAHLEPILHPEVSKAVACGAKSPYAMMDSSDGLFDALSQISAQSCVRVNVEYSKIPKTVLEKDFVLFGGEDYSLVVILSEEDFAQIDNPNLVSVGKTSSGKGVWLDGEEIKTDKSYQHWS